MATKGINPLEAHIEKIVVGLAGAALVGVLVWQFAGPTPTVRLGGNEVELVDAYGALERRANQVIGMVESPVDTETLPDPDMALGLLAEAEDFESASVAPSQRLATAFGTPGVTIGGDIPPPEEERPFATVEVPAPEAPETAQVGATVHPQELALHPDLTEFVADAERPDIHAVSVEAVWSAKRFVDSLRADPDGDGPIQPIPMVWWNVPEMTIFDVELLRQKRLADGTWGTEESVTHMPGRIELREEMGDEAMTTDRLRQWASNAVQFAEDIRRPPFYSIVFGDDWMPPSEVDELAGAQALGPEAELLMRKLEGIQRDIARLEEQLAALGAPQQQDPRGRPGPGGGHDRPPDREREREREEDRSERRKRQLEARLERLREQEQETIEELRALGVRQIPGVQEVDPMLNQPVDPMATEADLPLLEAEEIRIWAHDIDVEPGATYRYRLRVWVTNPMFGHEAGLIESQKSLAEAALIASEPSAWSDPVAVDDETYYFITSAQEGGVREVGLDTRARATASVFIFRWGYWREGTTRMDPGDILMASVESPLMGEMLPEVDVPPGEAPRPIAPQPHRPQPHEPRRPMPGGQEIDAAEPEEAPEIEYERIDVSREVVLLDVGPSPAAAGDRTAYLREEGGRIVDRAPSMERRKTTYQRLVNSAARGKEALKPKEADIRGGDPLAPPRGPDEAPPREHIPTRPGGGSGGG